MLEALMKGPGALPEDAGMLFFAGHESSLIDVVGRVSDGLGPEHPLRSDLQGSWFTLSNRSGVPLPPHLAPPLPISPPIRDEHYARNAVVKSVYYLSMLSMRSRSCAGRAVRSRRSRTRAGGRSRSARAAKCRATARERASARTEKGDGVRMGHKRLCGAFATLGASECPQLTLEEFTDVFVRAEPQLGDADVLALNEFVNNGIRAILGHDLPN